MAFLFADDMHLFIFLIAQIMHKEYTANSIPEFQKCSSEIAISILVRLDSLTILIFHCVRKMLEK